ncbi:hypothetical protein [Brumicola nitratireducens]|uniref:Uncharacterized protein n=1 Tax=Glaciecola nitratireducens (strain JCM 12485 / KCTC 12276 / FR1064) TaxID=1085623 RepID=G4QE30_GLANF|nr:hypothetical protein [Glaciecola nitratireducens]AEP31304.1 hypothetical protein GNIT_3210 [Glaciecola nitratireducens FR1064]
MTDKKIILTLKIVISVGISLILLGVYFHLFNQTIEDMGVNGIIISAGCVAVGMALSLPTKMFLTFLLVKREMDQDKKKPSKAEPTP